MCCQFWADESPEIREIVEQMNRSPLVEQFPAVTTSGEVRPTNVVPVIATNRAGVRSVFPMKWGFTGQTHLMNARTETAPIKETFREAWASHRCIVPASYYFEWEHLTDEKDRRRTGDKNHIQPVGSTMTWLCDLYRIENGLPAFVILTRDPGDNIRFIHDRMPLIMPREYVDEWIRPDAKPEELVKVSLPDMQFEKAVG